MLTEKDLFDRAPTDFREALEAVLERYQRHLIRLEAELAELRADLSEPRAYMSRRRLHTTRPASFRRPPSRRSVGEKPSEHTQPEPAIRWDS
jgi:hypothetical protein